MIERSLLKPIRQDLDQKIVILSGPRQSGKTTISKHHSSQFQYLTFDSEEDRRILTKLEWDRRKDLIVFDELHKMRHWKSWLKGIYDKEGNRPRILVTGSARLTRFKKTGDSLAGRYFNFRLHPLDLNELAPKTESERDEVFETLMTVGDSPSLS